MIGTLTTVGIPMLSPSMSLVGNDTEYMKKIYEDIFVNKLQQ